ncbi:MAG: hypothetical protein ACQESD_06515 [Thermoplasmatota archaeon]
MNFKTISNLLERKKLNLLTLTSSVFFLLLTAAKTHLGAPEASVYWYASNLYWTFWPGLVLSIASIILSIHNKRKYLGLISVLIPVFYLYTLPSLVHDMLPVFDVYHVIPQVLAIVETGQWNMQMTPFPGSHIYQAVSVITFDIHIMSYARIFPTILAFSIVIFIYTMARRVSKRWAPMAPLVFLALNWYMEYHLARQPFTIMLWTAFWLALFIFIDKKIYRVGLTAALILVALVPSHPGMLIIVSFNILALTVITLVSLKDKVEWNYFKPVIPILIAFTVVAFLFYTSVPPVTEYMDSIYEEFWEGLESGGFEISLGGPSATSFQYGFVNRLRMLTGILHSLLGLLGFIALYKYSSKKALFLGAWFFSIYLWLIYPLTQDGFLIERAFLASIVPASILTVALLKHYRPNNFDLRNFVRISVIVTIAALLIAIPITKNSIDAIETPSRPSYTAGRFSQENLEGRVYITDMHQGMFRYIESTNNSSVRFRTSGRSPYGQPYGYPIPRTDNQGLSPILFTDYFNNYIEIRYGNTTAIQKIQHYENDMSNRSARIYDSGGSRIYVEN